MGKSGCDQRYIDAQKADLSEAEFECVKNRICDKNEEMSKRGIRIPRDAVDWKDMNWFNFRRFVGDTYPFFQDGVLKFSNLGQYTKEERTRFFIDLWMNDIGKEKFNDIEKLPPHPDLYVQVFNHPYMFGVNGEVEGFGICKDIELAWQEKTAYDEYRGGGLRFAPDDWKNLIDKIQELGEKGANLRALFLEKRATEIYFEMLFDRTVQSKEKAQQQIERIPFFQEEPEWAGDTASVPLKYAREFWGEYLLFVSRYKEHEKIMRSYLADKNGLVNRLREIERKFPEVTAKLLNPDTAMFFAWSIDKNVDEHCASYLKTLCNQRVLNVEQLYYPWTWIAAAEQMKNPEFKISMRRSAKRNNKNPKLRQARGGSTTKSKHRGEVENYSASSIMKGLSRRQRMLVKDTEQAVDFLWDEELLTVHTNALQLVLTAKSRESMECVLDLYFYMMNEFAKLLLVPDAEAFLSLAAQFRVMMSGNPQLIKWYESYE